MIKDVIREVVIQEHIFGSGTLSAWAFRSNVMAAFPTDLRYGWDFDDQNTRGFLQNIGTRSE
eukprot:2696960-Pyramimonas_sp.AAC.1